MRCHGLGIRSIQRCQRWHLSTYRVISITAHRYMRLECSPSDADIIHLGTKFHSPGMRAAGHGVPERTREEAE